MRVTLRLAGEFQPEEVWLFGSHAWGQPDEASDLDDGGGAGA
jgi:hypothetical protein